MLKTTMRLKKMILLFAVPILVTSMVFFTLPFNDLRATKPSAVETQQENLGCLRPVSENFFTANKASKKTKKFSRKADYFPESRLRVDTSKDEQKCPDLYRIARDMLNGEKIKLPHETNRTRWKFREPVDFNVLSKTNLHWNHPWEQGDSVETRRRFEHYNVTASTMRARKYLITYGHNCCKESKIRAVNKAIDVAKVDYAETFDLSDISVPFQISHSKILRRRKGAGYWLWKPYIILKTLLTKMNDGDMLMYNDAGTYWIKDAGPIVKVCMETKHNIVSFHQPYQESEYSKRDAFVLMDMDDPRVYQKGQTQRMDGFIVLMKTCKTIQFAMEFLAYTADGRITTDDKNVMGKPNFPNFKGNRHGHTVFSLLTKKWGVLELRDPCTCGRNGFGRDYGHASGPYYQLYVNDRNLN